MGDVLKKKEDIEKKEKEAQQAEKKRKKKLLEGDQKKKPEMTEKELRELLLKTITKIRDQNEKEKELGKQKM